MLEWLLPIAIVSGAAVEAFVAPRAEATVSPVPLIVSGCVAGVLIGILLLLTDRPVFSAAAAVVLMITLVAVSNAKFAVLHEPLVFVDFAMLEQIAKHPQLFVPYLGIVPAALIVGSVGVAIGAAIELERPLQLLPGGWPIRLVGIVGVGVVATVGFRLLQDRLTRWGWGLKPSLDPRTDVTRFGLFGSLLLTALLSYDQTGKDITRRQRRRTLAPPSSGKLSDIVVVQAESFFDVRLVDRRIDRSLLRCFDACAAEAVFRGRLAVPAWGAYTQRTEFAFLTGLSADELGTDRFNPYLRFAKRPVWSIAHELRELGYQTICIHPFVGSFFGRRRVLPNLGFDVFLDIAAFRGAREFGPYVSDLSIAEKIADVFQEPGRPKFIFAITMENHGQWRKDRLPAEEIARAQALAPGFPSEFLCYLRHLANTDAMIGQLAGFLRRRGGTLCVFGDHLPSFPRLFERTEFADPRSDYFIWRPDCAGSAMVRDVDVVNLSDLLLSAMQIRPAISAGIEPSLGRQEEVGPQLPSAVRLCNGPTQGL